MDDLGALVMLLKTPKPNMRDNLCAHPLGISRAVAKSTFAIYSCHNQSSPELSGRGAVDGKASIFG
ncbi:MAG: hypothetical protein NVSMB42_13620 [Herpetosiphon sp.]